MFRSAACASLLLAAAIPSARAATYTFADSTGAPYCNSITLDQGGGLASGAINGENCSPPGKSVGAGVLTRIPGYPNRVWSFGYAIGKNAILVLLDEKALAWGLYTSSRANGFKLQEVSSGTLLKGKIDALHGTRSILPAE